MQIIAITQARSGSSRLPEKVLKTIGDRSMLEIHLERLKRAKRVNRVLVATTLEEADTRICAIASQLGLESFQGSVNDVLDRFYQAVKHFAPQYVVRVTSDCPLIDPDLIDSIVDHAIKHGTDYCSNILKETFPDGQDIEVMKFSALEKAWNEATLSSDREHVTPFIRKNCDYNGGNLFTGINIAAEGSYGDVRMTVDEQADFDVIRELVTTLGPYRTWKEYADYMIQTNLTKMNAFIKRNEGYAKSIKNDNNI